MFSSTFITSLVAFLCAGIGATDARTIIMRQENDAIARSTLMQRDVINPPITSPTTGTQWDSGSRQTVTWDTSVIPPGFHSNGMIVLGYLTDADGPNEHLDLQNPLAKDFPITDGHVDITVPSVPTRDTYILVLFGDSGNASGKFTIHGLSIGGPSPSSSSAAVPAPSPSNAPAAAPSSSSADDKATPSSADSAAPTSPAAAGYVAPTSASALTKSDTSADTTAPVLTPTQPIAATSSSVTIATSVPKKNSASYSVSFGGSSIYVSVACILGALLGPLV